MKHLFSFLFLSICFYSFNQKHKAFEGKLVYQIEFTDSVTKQTSEKSFMTVYTNDTLVRIENESIQLGQQITIRHLILNKYYILLEVNGSKYAIQHQGKSDTIPSKYKFKKKFGSQTFAGKKAKKVLVTSVNFSQAISMYYFKDLSPKYLEVLKGIPGLPAEYYIQNDEGMFHYKLISISEEKISAISFGIPSDYQRVSFEEFVAKMMQTN